MSSTRRRDGFTLVELLVAMVVTSIVLAAVATLAYAMSVAGDMSDNTSQKQAQLRYTTLRISQLIRNCKLICTIAGNDLAIWRADDNDNGKININELVYIEADPEREYLQLCEFSSPFNPVVKLNRIDALTTKWWLKYSSEIRCTQLLTQCSNVEFSFDVSPPWSRFVSISFDLSENDIIRHYQINAALRAWADHLLNKEEIGLIDDDD